MDDYNNRLLQPYLIPTCPTMMSSKKKSSTRSYDDVWIPQRHSSGEVLATVLQVTLPIDKLVLLSLQYMYRMYRKKKKEKKKGERIQA